MMNEFNPFAHYIFGIGNSYASDDRIGLFLIDELSKTIDITNCYVKKIETDLFELVNEFENIPESKPILIVDAILTDKIPSGSVVVFNLKDTPPSEINFATISHSLSVLDLITMNRISSKRKLSITFLGIVIENTAYGENINSNLICKKNFILHLITKYCANIDITGIYK